jgi:hypothetical protein
MTWGIFLPLGLLVAVLALTAEQKWGSRKSPLPSILAILGVGMGWFAGYMMGWNWAQLMKP